MELWIRSQDKEQLMKLDNVRVKHEYEQKKVDDNYGRTCAYINGKYRCSHIYNDSTWLGEYKTKERALEVLDEIQEVLCPKILMMKPNSQITLNDGVNIVLPDNCSYERIGDTYVFEMPKE